MGGLQRKGSRSQAFGASASSSLPIESKQRTMRIPCRPARNGSIVQLSCSSSISLPTCLLRFSFELRVAWSVSDAVESGVWDSGFWKVGSFLGLWVCFGIRTGHSRTDHLRLRMKQINFTALYQQHSGCQNKATKIRDQRRSRGLLVACTMAFAFASAVKSATKASLRVQHGVWPHLNSGRILILAAS